VKRTERSKLGSVADIRSLEDQAYEIIKEAIVSLQLKPGERLKESMLAKELGISTTPIKGALARLEQEGFVETTRFRGASVAEIDDRDMEEIFELRELLEGAAVKKAALNFSSEDLQKGKALLEAMRETYEAGDIKSYAESSREFHHLFIRVSGNQRMMNIVKTFDDQLERIRRTDIATRQNIPLFIKDYEKILEALRKKEPGEAERATLAHIRRAKEIFLKIKPDEAANR